MTPDFLAHLSADELDALHENLASPRATSHFATCQQCRELVAADRRILSLLGALPTWDAAPDLAPRVLARLSAPLATERAPVATSAPIDRAAAARRRVVVLAGVFAVVLGIGFGWALLNPAAASRLATPLIDSLIDTGWLALQAVSANTLEQPWIREIRDALATPARAVPLLALAGVGYALMLTALRKVLSRSASHASL